MLPRYTNSNVVARCPDCGTPTTFEVRSAQREYGYVAQDKPIELDGRQFSRTIFVLMRCAGCGRGGLASIADTGRVADGQLREFFPDVPLSAPLPDSVPTDLTADVREAERCASVRAYRGGVALLRSVLERLLKLNGYRDPDPDRDRRISLRRRLEMAHEDGIIAPTRWSQVDGGLREFANDILHDEAYRAVNADEFGVVHNFTQRLLEDFYGAREVVERRLRERGRLSAATG